MLLTCNNLCFELIPVVHGQTTLSCYNSLKNITLVQLYRNFPRRNQSGIKVVYINPLTKTQLVLIQVSIVPIDLNVSDVACVSNAFLVPPLLHGSIYKNVADHNISFMSFSNLITHKNHYLLNFSFPTNPSYINVGFRVLQ